MKIRITKNLDNFKWKNSILKVSKKDSVFKWKSEKNE